MSDPRIQVAKIFDRLAQSVKESVSKPQMDYLGTFAANLIVKRTRLGYGVQHTFGAKETLKALTPRYIKSRSRFSGLSSTTSPGKSNLTRTGQLLASVGVLRGRDQSVTIGPSGNRSGSSLSNLQVAAYQQQQGRTFCRLSELEYQQTVREFRREFGDLLRKRRVIT